MNLKAWTSLPLFIPQLAVYAEFCQDWASAVTAYSEAYQHILALCPHSASARSSQTSSSTPGTPSSSQPYNTPFGSNPSSNPGSSQHRSGSSLAGSGFPKSGSMAARASGAEGQPAMSLQRYVEVCRTAELAHLKLLMLLLHQGRLEDAAGQAREHHAAFLEAPGAFVHHTHSWYKHAVMSQLSSWCLGSNRRSASFMHA